MIGPGKLDWSAWFYSLVSGFIAGGAGAVISGVTVSAVDPEHFNPSSAKFYLLVGSIFLSSGTLNALAYLKQQPLPSIKTVTTTETVIQPKSPPKITTTVEETKITPQ